MAVAGATILAIENPDPFARPGQKKQGREKKAKAREKDNFKDRSGKRRPSRPKKHTPMDDHRKFKIVFPKWWPYEK